MDLSVQSNLLEMLVFFSTRCYRIRIKRRRRENIKYHALVAALEVVIADVRIFTL